MDHVLNDNALLFQQVDEGSFYAVSSFKYQCINHLLFKAIAHCGITVLEQNMPKVGAHLVMKKHHPLMPMLNATIRRNRHRFIGLALKYYRKAMEANKCPNEDEFKPLSEFYFKGEISRLLFQEIIVVGKSGNLIIHKRKENFQSKRLDISLLTLNV